MPFEQTIQPQFRDADEDSLIGLRGCIRYFKDIHTWYRPIGKAGGREMERTIPRG